MPRRFLPLFLTAFACASLGCGGTGNVSGKVYLQDSPVTSGNVFFYRQGSNSVTAAISPDGSYRAENVPTGTVKVAVLPLPKGSKLDAKAAGMMKGMQKTVGKEQTPVGEAPTGKIVTFTIPENYQDPEKSGLTVSVSRGDNPPFDIKLK
jgi:hypothetical protein